MGLIDIDEERVVGRDAAGEWRWWLKEAYPERCDAAAHDVMERRVREPPIVLAIETNAMQLQLQRVAAVARGVEEQPRLFVHLDQRCRLEALRCGERSD